MMATTGEQFARALAAKDGAALRALLADTLDFQALTPGRHWQAATSRQAVEEIILGHWFGAGAHIRELCSVARRLPAAGEPVRHPMMFFHRRTARNAPLFRHDTSPGAAGTNAGR